MLELKTNKTGLVALLNNGSESDYSLLVKDQQIVGVRIDFPSNGAVETVEQPKQANGRKRGDMKKFWAHARLVAKRKKIKTREVAKLIRSGKA